MTTTPDKPKGRKIDYSKLARLTSLALSVGFELAAGPFIGYYAGTYLVQRLGWSSVAISIFVFVGFFVGLYAATLTVSRINEVNRKAPKA
jgi:hypothetical protein